MAFITTKKQMRVLGIVASIASLGVVIYYWYVAFTQGVYWTKISLLFPFCFFIFLSVALDPITNEECLEKYGSHENYWRHAPLRQKILLFLGIVAGILNWAILSGTI